MSHFRLLKDPGGYAAQDWDLLTDHAGREYWLNHFEKQFAHTARHAAEQYGRTATKRIAAAGQEFLGALARLRESPAPLSGNSHALNLIDLDRLREGVLRKHGLNDPYARHKARANAAAARLYPQVVRKLHVMQDQDKWLRLIQAVLAGNILDMGSQAGMELDDGPLDFLAAMDDLGPRPWLVDDFDRLRKDLLVPPPGKWSKAVVFVDNAGADFVLGLMPLARELGLRGTKIVLAANERAALNDMTADETIAAVEQLAAMDSDLAALIQADMMEVVSSGGGLPVLDLSDVSEELNAAAAEADLVILEGMGRAVETNLNASFTVDALHLALIKSPDVARRLNGQVSDCVCKYTPVGAEAQGRS